MSRIKNPFLGLPIKETRKQMFKIYHSNISMIDRSHKEYYALMFMLNRFGSIFREKNNIATYEGALSNQTLTISISDMRLVDTNKDRVRKLINKFVDDGIMKRIGTSSYIINPMYCEHLGSKQVKFANDIIANEFG